MDRVVATAIPDGVKGRKARKTQTSASDLPILPHVAELPVVDTMSPGQKRTAENNNMMRERLLLLGEMAAK